MDPMNNLVVLITGGLTGIGRAAAVAFAKKGAKVVVGGRRDEAGKALVEELRSFGSPAEYITPTSAKRMTCARWSTRPSHGLAASMSR
jgi:NAD(P)-dependent dehydrogenase (short-subunit alcohol dehydrogenase family)